MDSNDGNLYNESLISHYLNPEGPLRKLLLSEKSFEPLRKQEEFCLKRAISHLKKEAEKLKKRLSELEDHLKQHEWIVMYLQKEMIFSYKNGRLKSDQSHIHNP